MLGTILILVSAFLIVLGVVEVGAAAAWTGAGLGLLGGGSLLWGSRARDERRAALLGSLQQRVLRLATSRAGVLTVTEVAAELDVSMAAAEKVLVAMDDGFRVRSEITEDGILFYEFPEVRSRPRLEPGDGIV